MTYDPSTDGRQIYTWLTRPWRSMWFQHGPDRFNIYTLVPFPVTARNRKVMSAASLHRPLQLPQDRSAQIARAIEADDPTPLPRPDLDLLAPPTLPTPTIWRHAPIRNPPGFIQYLDPPRPRTLPRPDRPRPHDLHDSAGAPRPHHAHPLWVAPPPTPGPLRQAFDAVAAAMDRRHSPGSIADPNAPRPPSLDREANPPPT